MDIVFLLILLIIIGALWSFYDSRKKKREKSELESIFLHNQRKLEAGEAPLSEIIKKEFGQEINLDLFDYYLPLLKETKRKAKKFSPFKYELNLRALSAPKPPRPRTFYSPGNSLEEYLQYIAYDYGNKRSEYFLIGVFKAETPQWTYEIKGRSAWVTFDWDEILPKIKNEGTLIDGIAILHNHPVSGKYYPPSLNPTDEDLNTSLYAYYTAKKYGYNFLGAFILSKGLHSEYIKKVVAVCFVVWAAYMKSHLANILLKTNQVINEINQVLESGIISAEDMEKFSEELQALIMYVQELSNIKWMKQIEKRAPGIPLVAETTQNYPQEILFLTNIFLDNINHLKEELRGLKNKQNLFIDDLKSLIKPYNLKAQEWIEKIQEISELFDLDFLHADVQVQGRRNSETRFLTIGLQIEWK